MKIKDVIYSHEGAILADINGETFSIPDDMGNRHRQLIAEWEASGNVIKPYIETEPEPAVTVLSAVTLWERLTEAEADRVNDAMATQPVRTQRIFTTANTFRSDHELWPLLEQMANQLFGKTRAAELLAP
ncbi:hypothetical protein [Falsochrobactrum tianjinense]|uniref:hypothetical protein n=1 Tax=Falsochrobactrum tianjinense TaxID=2706015 RepID=UPI0020C8880C|nr:hypothetical protein [Falsochrobactrum sp. TDYN1]